MFLVPDKIGDVTYLVFTGEDPRRSGYTGDVIDDVTLDYDMQAVHAWPNGAPSPEVCVGRAPADAKHFKVFKYESDRQAAGYQPVPGDPVVFGSWLDYLNLRTQPPNAETPDEWWYDYLDKLDEAARQRRERTPEDEEPASSDRDEVARWVAKKHFIADSGIREVWYLPKEAPPHEIRLLEVNDRFIPNEDSVDATDVGLNVGGSPFQLSIADVSTDQLEQLKGDPTRLPAGWSLDGSLVWRRRGA
ncbi:MAG TPA: hypothetical protein VFI31_00495 [Pirellulales bacterium]|nr:hypothetical protein [Pirellulales bacterium]